MNIAADSVLFPADHQCDLAVCFKANETIDHMTACLFQFFRPYNVVLLIETGFQLTRTDTCLPFSAACARLLIIGEFPLTRYSVCLIARTSGSLDACRMKSTTGSKVSYG